MATEPNQGRLGILAFAVLHLLCCGIPLLLASGFSLAFLKPHWPVLGVAIAVMSIVGFAWCEAGLCHLPLPRASRASNPHARLSRRGRKALRFAAPFEFTKIEHPPLDSVLRYGP